MNDNFQPHHHIATRYSQKTGSPYQAFKRNRRKLTAWDIISTLASIFLALTLLVALPWEAGW